MVARVSAGVWRLCSIAISPLLLVDSASLATCWSWYDGSLSSKTKAATTAMLCCKACPSCCGSPQPAGSCAAWDQARPAVLRGCGTVLAWMHPTLPDEGTLGMHWQAVPCLPRATHSLEQA